MKFQSANWLWFNKSSLNKESAFHVKAKIKKLAKPGQLSDPIETMYLQLT